MQVTGQLVPRQRGPSRTGFDVTELCGRLLALYEHAFTSDGRGLRMSATGPAMRFVSKALHIVSKVEIDPGAIYQRVRKARLTPDR